MDAAVRKRLNLSASPMAGPFRALERRGVPTLYGYSRHVLPRPADWPARCEVTGYWFLDSPSEWKPAPELLDFLDRGEPPVYIGFGSMAHRDPEATTRLILRALDLSGQRGVIASGWGGLSADRLPDTVYRVSSVPHDWLFPRMAAVVHHGGAGTTAAGLRAGAPTIIVPFFGDQPFWGERVARLGVGTPAIPRRRLDAETLAAAIRQAVGDDAMRRRARQLGQAIDAEQGVATAIRCLEAWGYLDCHRAPGPIGALGPTERSPASPVAAG